MKRHTDSPIRWLLTVHLMALAVLSLFRLLLLVLNRFDAGTETGLILRALIMGVRFDNAVCCYVLVLPAFMLLAAAPFPRALKACGKAMTVLTCTLLSAVTLIAAADIPYYHNFSKRINASIWNWLDEPAFVADMALQERSLLVYLLAGAAAAVLLCRAACRLRRRWLVPDGTSHRPYWTAPLAVVLVVPLYVLGIRGRLEVKSPLRIGTSYFCANPFLNQLGQNAAFVLLRTSMDMGKRDRQHIDYMPTGEAIALVRTELGLHGAPADSLQPLARTVVPHGTPTRQNVVVILMESMALHYIEDATLTPFLNSLIRRSDYYTHGFSAGIHTMNGLAATFFAEPALMSQHPFKTNQIQCQQSLAGELRKQGYRTYYFTTHDEQFDNVAGYLLANDVEHIISKKDYPEEEILSSSLGCADDYLFRHGIGVLRQATEQSEAPFLGVFLTINNHPPYTVPTHYKARRRDMEQQVVEYADWALGEFFRLAEQEPWYGNTLFVLMGDHGRVQAGEPYDVSLAYHRIPILFFDPAHSSGSVRHDLALQNDVFPTVMGRLRLPWTNTTTGIDLEREKHERVCFSSDNAYACVDSVHYYVWRDTGLRTLYDYTKKDGRDLLAATDSLTEERIRMAGRMDSLARAYLQAGQHLVDLRVRRGESAER